MEKDGKIFLVEVKTLASSFGAFGRVGKKQMQRLRANANYLSQSYKFSEFQAYVAFVQADQTVSFASLN